MNGSSCPTCGWVLRWLPDQNAWGCDRCRKIVAAGAPPPQGGPPMQPPPPQQQAAPQASPYAPPGSGPAPAPSPYAPPPPGAPAPAPYAPAPGPGPYPSGPGAPGYGPPMGAMPPPGRRSSKGLWIGLGVGAVAVTGIIIAVVVATGGSGGGAGSRDALVKSTVAAMSDGDVEKLLKLSDPEGLYKKALDCSEREQSKKDKDKDKDADADDDKDRDRDKDKDKDKDKDADSDDDDPAMQAKRMRRKHEKMVDELKGMKLELVSVKEKGEEKKKKSDDDDDGKDRDRDKDKDKDDEKGLMKKGDKAGKGCVFRTDVRMHELVATVKVTESGDEPAEQEATLFALEVDGSWYLGMPPKLRPGLGALEAGLKKYKSKMCACKDTACADEVQKDYKDWTRSQRDAAEKLSRSDRRSLDDLDDEIKACRRKLRDGDEAEQARQAIAKMEELKNQMCQCADKACAERVNKAMTDWGTSMAAQTSMKTPRPEDSKRIMEIAEELGKCMAKAMTADTPPPDDPPPPPPPDDPPAGTGMAALPACADYRRQIDKIRSCPKFPPTTADTVRRGYEQMERNYARSAADAAARQRTNKSCEQIADALKKSIEAICP